MMCLIYTDQRRWKASCAFVVIRLARPRYRLALSHLRGHTRRNTCRIECTKKKIPPTKLNIFSQFIIRVRKNIHAVICMSPLGDDFRRRLRMFPSFTNCCTIDWFDPWPDEALRNVANRFMTADVKLGEHKPGVVEFFKVCCMYALLMC